MITLCNFKDQYTISIMDNCICVDNIISYLYDISPYRVSDELIKNKLSVLDKIPHQYFDHLSVEYKHYIFIHDPIIRLINYFNKVKSEKSFSVLEGNFPRKHTSTFEHLASFVLETYPDNLKDELKPYPKNSKYVILTPQNLTKYINIDCSKYSWCQLPNINIDQNLKEKINKYYDMPVL